MNFNRVRKKLSENFSIQNNLIECVQQYKYLGIYFCNSGSFAFAQNSYEKKILKSMLKITERNYVQLS